MGGDKERIGRGYVFHCREMGWRWDESTCFIRRRHWGDGVRVRILTYFYYCGRADAGVCRRAG